MGKKGKEKEWRKQAFAYSTWWNKKKDKHGELSEISHCKIPICSMPALLTHSICSFSPYSLHLSLSAFFIHSSLSCSVILVFFCKVCSSLLPPVLYSMCVRLSISSYQSKGILFLFCSFFHRTVTDTATTEHKCVLVHRSASEYWQWVSQVTNRTLKINNCTS